ncbi:hypothetical protein D8B26_007257 [Coccidioides posadasii str. Silveira]|uniref:Inner centromere protein Mis6 n=2 Tax=Coccidioides posadasii TaxID=199306 RepID=E9D383_COCPS|nr:hypothetical protein CPC735_013010 [Coccidioides posadasii C735 delta SOWgp]EER29983.1 hypothetical protein CPC735_013010 [Coccidioides posadasii C735 delta SOWgp]EFW19078.1 inner centromere protein Mis6 [Coccidioides posadasii str. Silveira]QVM12638.1 hypothetical protein D8B26_007257 [Coccidioides posadasii str. Silveira]|eukprot:XP_003072128.1 hypothetical protein CPC735_013010 [Coccidioides posadasii C735 delta SOWgp]
MQVVSSPTENSGTKSWNLEEAITQLENVAYLPKSQRHTNVAGLAKTIATLAYESGIGPNLLDRLTAVIVKSKHLDQNTVTTLVKNLYPSEKVTSGIIARVVCSLGPTKTKPSPGTQSLLLRWLILVYDDLDDQSYLSKLYAVLFDNLDMISLRRSLCHLLSLVTRRKHVKPYRIQALMELIRNAGDETRELLGLLHVFKSYYPEIIVGEIGFGRRRATYFFKHPDAEWTAHLRNLQEKAASSARGIGKQTFQIVRREGVKRSRIEVVIPSVQTSKVHHGFASLEELRSVKDFVQKLDRIQLPNQIASALADPLAQKYLLLVQNKLATRRMESWLASFFEDELDMLSSGDADTSGHLGYVLDLLVDYVRFTKELPCAVLDLFRSYLSLWNGKDHQTSILALLEYLPIQEYEYLHRIYFSQVEAAILNDSNQGKASLLSCYTNLIRHWGCLVRSNTSLSAVPPLSELVLRAELLSLALLETPSNSHGNDQSASLSASLNVLHFYIELAQLFSHAPTHTDIPLTIPLPQTIYLLTFIPAVCSISLLGDILARYKTALEALNSTSQSNRVPQSEIIKFNGYVLDTCNLLWRNRALNSSDLNALGCLVPAETVTALTRYIQELNGVLGHRSNGRYKSKFKLVSMFSLSYNLALCRISAACVKSLEDQAEEDGVTLSASLPLPVTQDVLTRLAKDGGISLSWQEYRLKMLDWLDSHGSKGIGSLMRSAMINLRKA